MASDAFIAACKSANRKLVTVMAVESVDALVKQIDSQLNWQAYQSLTGLNTVALPGSLICGTDAPSDYTEPYEVSYTVNETDTETAGENFGLGLQTAASSSVARCIGTTVYGTFKTGYNDGETKYDIASFDIAIYGSRDGGAYEWLAQGAFDVASRGSTESFSVETGAISIGAWVFYITVANVSGELTTIGSFAPDDPVWQVLTFASQTASVVPSYHQGETRTMVLDLGATPGSDTVYSIDDIVPYGTALTVSARGGDTSPPANNLGIVEDGDSLAAYRYYDFYLEFEPTADDTPKVSRISISGGDSQFEYFGTHADIPIQGVIPILPDKAVGSVSSKLDFRKVSSTGEAKVKINWTKFTGDLLSNGYLRNKTVYINLGFQDLPWGDFEPVFTGLWYEWDADNQKRMITATVRDVLNRFKKTKIPTETVDGSGVINTTAETFTESNIIQVMLDIIDYIGVQSRYIDRDAFETLRDSVFTGDAWKVTRTLAEPAEAWKLLGELCVLSGTFLIPLPTGELTIKQYDETDAAVATLDANYCDFGSLDGNLKEFYTRQFVYYAPNVDDPGDSPENYDNGYSYINATAELAWDEVAEQSFYDKWKMGYVSAAWTTTGHQALAERWDAWYSTPHMMTKVKNVPLYHIGIEIGDIVAVNNLMVPCSSAEWPGLTVNKKFLVMSKSVDLGNGTLSLDLMEVYPGRIGASASASPSGSQSPSTSPSNSPSASPSPSSSKSNSPSSSPSAASGTPSSSPSTSKSSSPSNSQSASASSSKSSSPSSSVSASASPSPSASASEGAPDIFTANDTWVVPNGITSITARCWGAGGGGKLTNPGGGGGFVKSNLTVTPGETLYIQVGGGGALFKTGGTNGGGNGGDLGTTSDYASGGGGYSGIFRTSVSQANALLVAGGGGGGRTAENGGAAGGTSGTAGTNSTSGGYNANGGGGGTPSAGGAGGTVSTGGMAGTAGSALTGGVGGEDSDVGDGGAFYANGGGGGGGYYGGGGGGAFADFVSTVEYALGGGGGGGSSYTTGASTTNEAASGSVPGGTSDPHYSPSYGGGGNSVGGEAGEGGYVVITYVG